MEHRYGVATRVDRWRGNPPRERVVQDVEIPLEATADFLRWFDANVPMSPLWLCPLQLRGAGRAGLGSTVAALPARRPGGPYVNIGFWGTVPIKDGARDGDVNRAVERAVTDAGGHKGLYSDAYYDRATFDRSLRRRRRTQAVKHRYDPDCPAHRPLREGGRTTMTVTTRALASAPRQLPRQRKRDSMAVEVMRTLIEGEPPVRITAYDGSAIGPASSEFGLHIASERGLSYLLTAPGDLGLARAYVSGDLELRRRAPGRPVRGVARARADPAAPADAGRGARAGPRARAGSG